METIEETIYAQILEHERYGEKYPVAFCWNGNVTIFENILHTASPPTDSRLLEIYQKLLDDNLISFCFGYDDENETLDVYATANSARTIASSKYSETIQI